MFFIESGQDDKLNASRLCLTGARSLRKRLALIGFCTVFLSSAALAETAGPVAPLGAQVIIGRPIPDRVERLSRKAFAFNSEIDHSVVGPITHTYLRVTPSFVRDRIGSVVQNLGEPRTVINDVSQGHPKLAGVATLRFLINSTIGGLGAFDVGQRMGLAPHQADFGQTLGRYGVEPGGYFVLPLLGPMTPRDALGRVVDTLTDPLTLVAEGSTTGFDVARAGASTLDSRASNDALFRSLDDAIDPFVTTQSAYTQRRAARVRAARGEAEILPVFDSLPPEPETSAEPAAEKGLP